MAIQFGPQLIGQTEKALNALLRRLLDGTGLDERLWVTLVLAQQCDAADTTDLASRVRDQAHFSDADGLVAELSGRGLLVDGRPTAAGADLISDVRERIERGEQSPPIWDGFDPADVDATARVLNQILDRARHNLRPRSKGA